MQKMNRETLVSPTERTIPVDSERTLASPRFDEKSIQRAQPAIPLTRGGRARQTWSTSVVVICALAALAGGVLGGLALTRYQSGSATTESRQVTTPAPPVVESAPDLKGAQPQPENSAPTDVAQRASEPKAGTGDAPIKAEVVGDAPASESVGAKPADEAVQGDLRSALDEWLAATNARDVTRQMQFYAPTVSAFYLSRNASRESVRAEKMRLFARADTVDVRASSAPEIRLSGDGQTAVMRFRKRYDISGSEGARRGEVLQELRWRRTPSGWRIISERDLRVLQ